jgi:hypothetical protein
MAAPALQPSISIDTKDLESTSALAQVVSSNQSVVFDILGEVAQYASRPVADAAAAKVSAAINLSADGSWKTSTGIGFSLTTKASCSIAIDAVSTSFPVAMSIDSTTTTNVSAQKPAGSVYVNIALDFDIQGSVSGSGNVSGIGIAGKASGAKEATLVFCQPVDGTKTTLEAVKIAFSQLVFPLDPACASSMQLGSLAKVAFDGTFDCEIDVTYGLGDHKVAAPSVAKVQQSLQNAVKITPPSLDINAGAKGSLTYKHSDHFGIIVSKTDSASAMLYLVRSSESDWGASVGVTVGVTATNPSVTIDQSALQTVVQKVTGSSAIASSVVSAASQPLNNLQTSVNAKLKSWASDVTGQAGLTFSLARQSGHTALFTFKVNLSSADLASQSWSALVGGSVAKALQIGGFALQPGSGVSDSLKRASSIHFQFFNLFAFTSTTDYFSNGYTELGNDGTIRVFRDIGQEQNSTTKKALSDFRIEFVATATEDALNNVSNAKVNLQVELSEKGSSKSAAKLANSIGSIPANPAVHAAQTAMATYVANNPAGTLNLITVVEASAYGKLAATAYNGSKPLPLPHEQDQDNWDAFQKATEALIPDLNFVSELNFSNWIEFNRDSVDQVGSQMNPDRRQTGNPNAVPDSFFGPFGPRALVAYFLQASQGFMNLCDDLHSLATLSAQANSADQWNRVLHFLTLVVTKDAFIDFTEPILSALLAQCSVAGAQVSTTADLAKDSSSLTCTLTLA